jgi:hypothetical protein
VYFGKKLIFLGLLISVIGVIVWLSGRFGFKGLPGDIRLNRGNTSFYFPIVTCIAISVILSLLLNLLSRFKK